MDPLPPSQSQQTPKSTIFTNSDGTPIRVFTQADLLGRGKVLKELRLNGAELSSDATNAQIMLVDPYSRQGKSFIDDWGQDSDRTVVNSAWVKKSIAAGRPLLEDDQWGDCLPREGAILSTNGDEDDDILDSGLAKSPLPTPRVTPEERAKMRVPTINAKRPTVDMKSYADDQSLTMLTPSPIATNNNPTDMRSLPPQPQPGIPPMAGMNPFLLMQNSPAMSGMTNMPGSMMTLAQAMFANMLMPNFMPNQQQISGDAFRLALQDSVRNQVMGWPSTQPQPGSSTENILPLQDPPLPYPMVPSIPMEEPALSPFLEQPSSRRANASSEFVSENSTQKGRGKERAPSPSYKRRKTSSSSAKAVEKYDIGTPLKAVSPSQGTLFRDEAGQSLCFYVQVDIHGRGSLLSMIKKNGGTIVGEAASADYAVLSAGNKRQKVYKSLLSVANSAGIPAIQAKFISECVSENRLLDSVPFQYDSRPIRKRKRSMSTASVESEDGDDAEDDRETTLPENKAQKNEKGTRAKTEKPIIREPARTPRVSSTRYSRSYPRVVGGARTPTPPPEHTREPWGAGFRFSQEENDFALRYAKILIDRDYAVSQSAVTAAIYKKLPHHTLSSWRTHFIHIASDWETWRKRGAIAFRKAQSQKEAEAAANVASALLEIEREMPTEESPSFADLPNGNHNDLEDFENDINAVVQFFVQGNDTDDTEDESVVWHRLAQQTPCRTEGSWEIFYEKYSQEVIDRYNRIVRPPT